MGKKLNKQKIARKKVIEKLKIEKSNELRVAYDV
jgi:hypothetical protein